MTLEKDRFIKIPIWLVAVVLPGIVSLIVAYGSLTGIKAELSTKSQRNEQEIQRLYEQKVDRVEMNVLLKTLDRIEDKLDSHIDKHEKK